MNTLLGVRCEPTRRVGRWAFAELTEVYRIQADFDARVQAPFDEIAGITARGWRPLARRLGAAGAAAIAWRPKKD